MRLLGVALVLVLTAFGCTSTDTPPAEMQGTELADDEVIRDQIPGPGATLLEGSIIQIDA
jgi:hypothetical protein